MHTVTISSPTTYTYALPGTYDDMASAVRAAAETIGAVRDQWVADPVTTVVESATASAAIYLV